MSSEKSHDSTHLENNEHDVTIWTQGARGSGLAQGERSATFSGDFGAEPRMGPFAFLGQRIWRDFWKDRTIFPPTSHAYFAFSHKRADEMLRARYAEIARDHPGLSTDCYAFSYACYNAFKAVLYDRGFTAINHTSFEQGEKYHPGEVVLADASADLARSLASQPSLLHDLANQIQPASSPSLSRFVKPHPTEKGVQIAWEEGHGFGDETLYTDDEDGVPHGMEEGWTTPVEEMFPPLFSPGSPVFDNTPPLAQPSVGSSPPGMQCGAASSAWPVDPQGSCGGISRR